MQRPPVRQQAALELSGGGRPQLPLGVGEVALGHRAQAAGAMDLLLPLAGELGFVLGGLVGLGPGDRVAPGPALSDDPGRLDPRRLARQGAGADRLLL